MELKLSGEEVNSILLEWANKQVPTTQPFNYVQYSAGYRSLQAAELSYVEPEKKDD